MMEAASLQSESLFGVMTASRGNCEQRLALPAHLLELTKQTGGRVFLRLPRINLPGSL